MSDYRNVAVVIPSLNPDEKMLSLLSDLREAKFEHIVVVNDGSAAEYDSFFAAAKEQYGCTVLVHAVNQGKGRAMKTAFHHILTTLPQCAAAVTVDADGQHRVKDICAVAAQTVQTPEKLVFGCRDFSSKTAGIPPRSRFGNVLTRRLLALLCGISLSDTQTGLRGFSVPLMRRFLATKGERYEFEMNMILDAKESGIELCEVPIETVYIEENRSSHFNPLKDSLRIYAVFGKFLLSSLSSFALDILLYMLFLQLLAPVLTDEKAIIASAYAARVLSSLYNFTVNRKGVFKSRANAGRSMVRYAILCVAQITVSALATSALFSVFRFGKTLWKFVVDIVLFVLSFRIQRGWVFK